MRKRQEEVDLMRGAVVLAGLLLLALVGGRSAYAAPAEGAVQDAISKLADPDPAVREQASQYLWSSGSAAESALRQAAAGDNPEIAGRARAILKNIDYGLLPNSPPEITALIDQYRRGDRSARVSAVNRLAVLGQRGLRVLLALRRDEKDASDRQLILNVLIPHAGEAATALIGSGELASAETLLESAAPLDESAARAYAALLLVQGHAADQLEPLKKSLRARKQDGLARELVQLARAAGDLTTARWAAEQASDPQLVDGVLIEQGDWKQLAARYRSRPGDSDSLESLAFAAGFSRVAGDAAGVEKAVDAIKGYADRHPDDCWKCAQVLFLNDRPDDGIRLLLGAKEYGHAVEFLMPRLQYKQALGALRRAAAERHAGRWALRLREAVALRYLGSPDRARQIIADITSDPRALVAEHWAMVLQADREIGDDDLLNQHRRLALSIVRPESAGPVLDDAGLPKDFPAQAWWEFLRKRQPDEPVAQTLKRLHEIAAGKVSEELLAKVWDAASAQPTRDAEQPSRESELIRSAAEAMFAAKDYSRSILYFRKLADLGSSPEMLQRVGDCQAAMQDWRSAAATYQQAWELNVSRPIPLALRAWALQQAGDTQQAKHLLEMAHLLPLADDSARLDLADVLSQHGFADDARREDDVIMRTAPILSTAFSRAYARRADEALERHDDLAAADAMERAFLPNLRFNISFMTDWPNLAIPALTHKTRALGLVHSGDLAGALREAKMCLSDTPGDADAMIELVNALHDHGGIKQSDELFNAALAMYRQNCELAPQSNPAHNLVAWFEGKCRRNLDDAVQHALRSVELEPRNAASLDTLAEVRFQRGEIPQAIEAIKKCIALEPDDPSHRKQLERFEAATRAELKTKD